MIPTLSMLQLLTAAFEVLPQSFLSGDDRFPAEHRLQPLITVPGLPPVNVPVHSVVNGWQLALRPSRVRFPQPAQRVADGVRNVNRTEPAHVSFVETQKLAAGRQVVVDDVENLLLDPRRQTCPNDGVRAVINERERQR